MAVLDSGASGVMIPHVDTPEKARAVAAACRYRNGNRGFANTTRAGSYGGATFADHIAQQDAEVTCIAMIEDESALAHVEAIAATDGIDAFFIGRGDLTAALGEEDMKKAVQVIAAGAKAKGMPVMVLVSSKADARAMRDLGASSFVYSNDQNLMKAAATQAVRDFADGTDW
jgi:staphyloferrin B biosynthesis citrate synthase